MNVVQRTLGMLLLTAATSAAATGPSTAVIDAARRGDAAAVRSLVREKSVDVNAMGADGATALQWAVQRDDVSMVEMLLRAGANARVANPFFGVMTFCRLFLCEPLFLRR